jgi:hypothetical protein
MSENKSTKKFLKNPIKGTKYTIAWSQVQREGLVNLLLQQILALALKSIGCKGLALLDADIYGPSTSKDVIDINEKPKSDGWKIFDSCNEVAKVSNVCLLDF